MAEVSPQTRCWILICCEPDEDQRCLTFGKVDNDVTILPENIR